MHTIRINDYRDFFIARSRCCWKQSNTIKLEGNIGELMENLRQGKIRLTQRFPCSQETDTGDEWQPAILSGFWFFFCRTYLGKIICFRSHLVAANSEDLWAICGHFLAFSFNHDDPCPIEGSSNHESSAQPPTLARLNN